MVKYTPKAKSFTSKNLSGIETVLRIDKTGKCVIVTLEQKLTFLLPKALGAFLTLIFIYTFDFYVSKYLTAVLLLLFLYHFLGVVYEESLIMVHSLGYQITSKSIVGQRDMFIPWGKVQSIFINEVVVRHKVIHLLTILTKDQGREKLVPLFLELQPRLKHLELICKHLKGASS